MSEARVAGVRPWLPWPLCTWTSWTTPAPAERLAALRIGVALVLLLDVALLYWPHVADFYGPGTLGSSEVFAARVQDPYWNWSLVATLDGPGEFRLALGAWGLAAVLLLLGVSSRAAALVAWALSVSFLNANPYLHNGGDRIRTILLFYLMLSPCGAAWSLGAWWRRKPGAIAEPVHVQAWPLRLLACQLAALYFMNGVYKVLGPGWRNGDVTHYLLQDLTWSRFVDAGWEAPFWLTQALTYTILLWELGFPFLVALRPLRNLTLWLGVIFHVASGIGLEIGAFAPYMLCFYLPLVPWERVAGALRQPSKRCDPVTAAAGL